MFSLTSLSLLDIRGDFLAIFSLKSPLSSVSSLDLGLFSNNMISNIDLGLHLFFFCFIVILSPTCCGVFCYRRVAASSCIVDD